MNLLKRFFICRKVGHRPGIMSTVPICIRCHGPLPGRWGGD